LNGEYQGWITTLIFLMIFLLMFTNLGQRIQLMFMLSNLKSKLRILERLSSSALARAEKLLSSRGSKNPKQLLNRLTEYFIIEPVSIEPIDIIKRLDHILNIRRRTYRGFLEKDLTVESKHELLNIEAFVEVSSALKSIYKIVRHLILLGEKTGNLIIVMQLSYFMPQILRIAQAYYNALDALEKGVPIGDGVGPLVASLLSMGRPRKTISEDTVMTEVDIKGRKLIVIKAEGPGASVGKPGEALEKIVEKLGGRVTKIITVDAAVKYEGEKTGEVAEGVGAAIGDPGPEKIRIERVAVKYNIPLEAIIIKISQEEAVQPMKKEIVDAARRAAEMIKTKIVNELKKGELAILAGIGNTIGIV